MSEYLKTGIEFLKGVGPKRSKLLQKELGIFTFEDLLYHFPYRWEDRTQIYQISDLESETTNIQIKGFLKNATKVGYGRKQRLVVMLEDKTGSIELVWFKGIKWILNKLKPNVEYLVYGKPSRYGKKLNIAHPEIEPFIPQTSDKGYLGPVYSTTETLRKNFLDSRAISKLQKTLLKQAGHDITENLSVSVKKEYYLCDRNEAFHHIHFPPNQEKLRKAKYRLKFEELFFIQLRLLRSKSGRQKKNTGAIFKSAELVTEFYTNHIPFELTSAQKKVIKEAYKDMRSGIQMNRLLQGDVGSGKTIVAFICMLLVIGGGAQAALMAPTEILAMQHYNGLKDFARKVGVRIALLTGSTAGKERKIIHQYLKSGELHILVGTHALLEETVQFKNLGLAVIDEQHRFGVAQRSRLWQKSKNYFPHVLVMTATPIPRTLAMVLYGDLDISVIDEMPAGRKPIKTIHRNDSNRLKVWGFIRQEIEKGRQVYIVYPLIEESAKMDLKDLMDGYESVCRSFPEYQISIVHGKMKSDAKEYEMTRFIKGEAQIMVATTVIEVGVDVSNATVMIIENAERFGLAQLHQLRGRVGRGAAQSYCILMTGNKLTEEAKTRIQTLVRTNDGFEIADVDLQLRGPGDLMGTQQSGLLDLKIADLSQDGKILQLARDAARTLLEKDPDLKENPSQIISDYLKRQKTIPIEYSEVG